MDSLHFRRAEDGCIEVDVKLRGRALLSHGLLNKGTAFTQEERLAFGLSGLLPHHVTTIETQAERAYASIARKDDPLERYIGMAALQDRDEVLFYRVLWDHVEELMPIVYTPTVGEACRRFSSIFRRGRGVWITPDDRGRIDEVLGNAASGGIRLIVVTDNERILGLGDQGAGGMGIPIGKLALYTMAAGIHPSETLPLSLDVGTDNQALLEDPLYVGYRKKRLRGADYDSLVEEMVTAVMRRYPKALLQWEDFKKQNAFDLLYRYRDRLLSFNDDIEGTAAVGLAGLMAACRIMDLPLAKQRVLILGAGAAGIGIARQIRDAMARDGLAGDDLIRAIALVDSESLLTDDRTFRDAYKAEFAWPAALARRAGVLGKGSNLREIVEALSPTALLGTSGQPGVFTEEAIVAMAKTARRPAIFPFSNPTSKSEAIPSDLMRWTEGRALIATGSPFDPVTVDGTSRAISQGNNVYVFPGVGLGALVSGATRITDAMFTVAAAALAASVTAEDLAGGALFPKLSQLREVTRRIAAAVVREARDSGVGRAIEDDAVGPAVESAMWRPEYPRMRAV